MTTYFFDNEVKANRLILNINWAPIIIGAVILAISSKHFVGEYRKDFLISLIFAAGLALIAEIWYFYGSRNISSGMLLKYYIIMATEVTACLMVLGVGDVFVLGIYFYPLITSALYHNRKVVLFSAVLNIASIGILASQNLINIGTPQYRGELVGEVLGTFILCIFVLVGHIKQSSSIVKIIEVQEKELANTNMKLQMKNVELKNKQVHLQFMNETLAYSNEKLELALEELKQTQKELIQHEKIASLGQLSAGVAHEINTPIGAIKSNIELTKHLIHDLKLEMLAAPSQESDEIMRKLESVTDTNVQACARIEKIVKSLKNFARNDKDNLQLFDVNAIIENVLVLLNSRIKDKILLIREYGEIPKIECYPGQLNQAFMNLIQNAIDAVKDPGTIWVSTGIYEKNKIYIKIKDNGSGINEKVMKNLFDPGFNTKGDRVATGFGLATVYKIVESHSGALKVDSEVDKGSEFTIILPMFPKTKTSAYNEEN